MKYFIALSLFAVSTKAFVPATHQKSSIAQSSTTSLGFGFLKELGLEKPTWLPDFGDKSKAPAEPVVTVAEVEDEAAPATDEVDEAAPAAAP